MKKIPLLLSLSFVYMLLQAQKAQPDSWKITWNKKVIIESSKSDETTNIRKIKAADFKKNYVLQISYKESDPKKIKEWNRTFMIFNESDNEISRKDSTRNWRITASELKK